MSKSPNISRGADQDGLRRTLAGIVLGLPTVVALAVLAFAASAVHSGPDDLPLAVSGPEPAVAQLIASLETNSPGVFEVTAYDSSHEAAEAIRDRKAIGGIAMSNSGVAVQIASGAGAPYASLLNTIGDQFDRSGYNVTYSDLAPTTEDDPRGAGITALGLPLIFGGMASAAALLLAYRGSLTSRLAAAFTLSVLGGFVSSTILRFVFGSFDGSYWLTAAAVTAGITAISFTVLGLGTLVGARGIAMGAVLMLFVSNPLSGLASGSAWLPEPWGAIGQYLPVGAAGSAIRSAAYFDGAGSARSWLVLGTWALCGLALACIGAARSRSQRAGNGPGGQFA